MFHGRPMPGNPAAPADPGGVEWATFLDQELARRESRSHFVWTAALAAIGVAYWLGYERQPASTSVRQTLAALSLGAILYWTILRRLGQRLLASAMPFFLPRFFSPIHVLLIARYLRQIGVPASRRAESYFEAAAAVLVVGGLGIFFRACRIFRRASSSRQAQPSSRAFGPHGRSSLCFWMASPPPECILGEFAGPCACREFGQV